MLDRTTIIRNAFADAERAYLASQEGQAPLLRGRGHDARAKLNTPYHHHAHKVTSTWDRVAYGQWSNSVNRVYPAELAVDAAFRMGQNPGAVVSSYEPGRTGKSFEAVVDEVRRWDRSQDRAQGQQMNAGRGRRGRRDRSAGRDIDEPTL